MIVVVFYSIRNDKLRPGMPEQGFFRMAQVAMKKVAAKPAVQRRQVRGL